MALSKQIRPFFFACLLTVLGTIYYLSQEPQDGPLLLNLTTHGRLPTTGDPCPPTAAKPYPERPPKIQIIAIWSQLNAKAIYLPHFLASVGANPSIDVLFIKFDKYGADRASKAACAAPMAAEYANVRELCLSVNEYWDLHADFLCYHWACTDGDRARVVQKLHERMGGDRVNSYFRPFRADVFAKWINPDTKIWGWCDMDLVFGSFERAFPWDIAYDFDMLIGYWPSPGADDVLLYMKGHLSFFRHSPEVTRQFLTFPNFRTQHAFLTLPWIETDAEEAEYSHFALLQTNLTFLQFDAMVPTRFHLTAGGGAGGTYGLFNDGQWEFAALGAQTDPAARLLFSDLMDEHARGWVPRATFSDAGHEREVHLRGGEFAHFVWFDRKFAVDYLSAFTDDPDVYIGARYVMRRAPGGRVVERFEPEPDAKIIVPPLEGPSIDYGHWDHWNRPYLHEMLYNHFQNEKYAPWWALPERPLREEEVLFVDKDDGAQAWDRQWRVFFDAADAHPAAASSSVTPQ